MIRIGARPAGPATSKQTESGAGETSRKYDAMDWRPASHFAPLDGVRGFAILLVLIHHLGAVMGPQSHIDYLFLHVVGWAWVGVDLFFVLSGFLITGILLDSVDDKRYYRTFYARRALRVFPLYYVFLTALALVILPSLSAASAHGLVTVGPEWLGNPVTTHLQVWFYLTNHLIAIHGFSAAPAFTAVLWSLAVEEQFYLVWPTVVRHMAREYLLWFAGAAIIAAFCVRVWIHYSTDWSRDASYVLTLARMDTLAVGAAIAIMVRNPIGMVRLRRWLPVAGVLSVIALLAVGIARGGFYSWDAGVQIFGLSASALACGVLVGYCVVTRETGRLNRILRTRWVRSFGVYSYGIYVLHSPVNWIGEHFFQRYAPSAIFGSAIPGTVGYVVVVSGVAFAIAWCSWHLLEQRFLALKRYFPPHRPPAEAASSAPPVVA